VLTRCDSAVGSSVCWKTVPSDRDGTPRLATPYGVRVGRPDLAAAFDRVEKAYDAELGTVRMGVRDYDHVLGQFWTPSPTSRPQIGRRGRSSSTARVGM